MSMKRGKQVVHKPSKQLGIIVGHGRICIDDKWQNWIAVRSHGEIHWCKSTDLSQSKALIDFIKS